MNSLTLILGALILAVLLILLLSTREGGRPGAGPGVTAVALVAPVSAAAPAVPAKKKTRVRKLAVQAAASEKPGPLRAKRVSRLRDPGEAFGGSAPPGATAKPAAAIAEK